MHCLLHFGTGSDLSSKYLGGSEKLVRSMFEHARNLSPCVLLLDEFDAIASSRGENTGVESRVLATLLNELDGIGGLQDGVHVIACTNRLEDVDKALQRPGRFDSLIHIPKPDAGDRREILRAALKLSCKLGFEELESLVTGTNGMSVADLLRVCQEGGLVAIRRCHKKKIEFTYLDVLEGIDRVASH